MKQKQRNGWATEELDALELGDKRLNEYSGPWWPPILIHDGHPFRSMVASDSDFMVATFREFPESVATMLRNHRPPSITLMLSAI